MSKKTTKTAMHRNVKLVYYTNTRTWFSAPFQDKHGDTCIVDGEDLASLKKLIDKNLAKTAVV